MPPVVSSAPSQLQPLAPAVGPEPSVGPGHTARAPQGSGRCARLEDYPAGPLAAVLAAACLSATAGISAEFLFKARPASRLRRLQRALADCGDCAPPAQEEGETSIFVQNSAMYFFGVLCNALFVMRSAPGSLASGRLLDGFDASTAAIVATMVGQGLSVAAVVKVHSNLAKVFAAACGMFVTAGLGVAMGTATLSIPMLLAALTVSVAVLLFSWERLTQAAAGAAGSPAHPGGRLSELPEGGGVGTAPARSEEAADYPAGK